MKRILFIIIITILTSCGEKSKNPSETKSIERTKNDSIYIAKPARQIFEFKNPTILIIELDSLEKEILKNIDKDKFLAVADDIKRYHKMLLKKMSSLKIPIVETNKDTVEIKTSNSMHLIVKDTTFSLYTYFYFDGNEISKQDIMDLLDQ